MATVQNEVMHCHLLQSRTKSPGKVRPVLPKTFTLSCEFDFHTIFTVFSEIYFSKRLFTVGVLLVTFRLKSEIDETINLSLDRFQYQSITFKDLESP